jgi:hypothetical protein
MKRVSSMLFVCALLAAACGGDKGGAAKRTEPGTEEGAKTLLTAFHKASPTERAKIAEQLVPAAADYEAAFDAESAAKIKKANEEQFAKFKGKPVEIDPANTELLLVKATSDELKATPGHPEFPGGYEKAGPHMKPGFTWYRWKYVKPGETSGMAYDGLVYVNGHWAWFPKPWRALGE